MMRKYITIAIITAILPLHATAKEGCASYEKCMAPIQKLLENLDCNAYETKADTMKDADPLGLGNVFQNMFAGLGECIRDAVQNLSPEEHEIIIACNNQYPNCTEFNLKEMGIDPQNEITDPDFPQLTDQEIEELQIKDRLCAPYRECKTMNSLQHCNKMYPQCSGLSAQEIVRILCNFPSNMEIINGVCVCKEGYWEDVDDISILANPDGGGTCKKKRLRIGKGIDLNDSDLDDLERDMGSEQTRRNIGVSREIRVTIDNEEQVHTIGILRHAHVLGYDQEHVRYTTDGINYYNTLAEAIHNNRRRRMLWLNPMNWGGRPTYEEEDQQLYDASESTLRDFLMSNRRHVSGDISGIRGFLYRQGLAESILRNNSKKFMAGLHRYIEIRESAGQEDYYNILNNDEEMAAHNITALENTEMDGWNSIYELYDEAYRRYLIRQQIN